MKNLTSFLSTFLIASFLSCFITSCEVQTFCEVSGPETATVGEIVTFTYSTDIPNPVIEWDVISGNITLISGQGTNTATFIVNGSGQVSATGTNGEQCMATESITVPSAPCETHMAEIEAVLDWYNCFVNIQDIAPRDPDCGPYTYEWNVTGLCPGNTMPFGNGPTTGFHAQFINGTSNYTVYVTVTNAGGTQIAPLRIFNDSSDCNNECEI